MLLSKMLFLPTDVPCVSLALLFEDCNVVDDKVLIWVFIICSTVVI